MCMCVYTRWIYTHLPTHSNCHFIHFMIFILLTVVIVLKLLQVGPISFLGKGGFTSWAVTVKQITVSCSLSNAYAQFWTHSSILSPRTGYQNQSSLLLVEGLTTFSFYPVRCKLVPPSFSLFLDLPVSCLSLVGPWFFSSSLTSVTPARSVICKNHTTANAESRGLGQNITLTF